MVRAAAVTSILMFLVPSVATAAATRFDLICTGQEQAVSGGPVKQDQRRYTLDLAAKRWCRTTECSEGIPILEVTADDVTLSKPDARKPYSHSHSISRVAGTYYERLDLMITKGSCKVAPFSGFPKAKF